MQGIQAVLGRIAQIEAKLDGLQPVGDGGHFAQALEQATEDGEILRCAQNDRQTARGNGITAEGIRHNDEILRYAQNDGINGNDEILRCARNDGINGSDGGRRGQGKAEIDIAVQRAAGKYGLDPGLVHAVIRAESDYNPRCHSHAGAMGLMQLMPETCRDYGIRDPYDVTQNIEGGCRELAEHLKQFGGNARLALAAYNAGPNAVRRYGGIPPYRETQAYVPRVMRYWKGGRQ